MSEGAPRPRRTLEEIDEPRPDEARLLAAETEAEPGARSGPGETVAAEPEGLPPATRGAALRAVAMSDGEFQGADTVGGPGLTGAPPPPPRRRPTGSPPPSPPPPPGVAPIRLPDDFAIAPPRAGSDDFSETRPMPAARRPAPDETRGLPTPPTPAIDETRGLPPALEVDDGLGPTGTRGLPGAPGATQPGERPGVTPGPDAASGSWAGRAASRGARTVDAAAGRPPPRQRPVTPTDSSAGPPAIGDTPSPSDFRPPSTAGGAGGETDPSTVPWGAVGAEYVAHRYEVDELLGRGGMGAVYRAVDRWLDRTVAIKLCFRVSSRHPAVLARFEAEARVTSDLDHPGIVPVYDVGRDRKGRPYYVMKLIRGRSLDRVLKRTARSATPPVRRHVALLLKVCEAVAFAHSRGVLHRDLKPANVMVGEFGEVLVVDWGLARFRDGEPLDDRQLADGLPPVNDGLTVPVGEEDPTRTREGQILGTPSYMAPEQVAGKQAEVDHRADVFSLGAVLYELLAGVAPYAGDSVANTLYNIAHAAVPSCRERAGRLRARALPRELEAIAMKAIERDPADRYGSARELADELQRFLEGLPVEAFREGALARAGKWLRRHQLLASASAAVATIVLVAGAVAGLALYRAERASRRSAQEKAVLAEERAKELEAREAARPLLTEALDLLERPLEPAVLRGEVLPLLARAVTADPSFVAAHLAKARVHRKLGERWEELQSYEEAARRAPNDSRVQLKLGYARLYIEDDAEGARIALVRAARLGTPGGGAAVAAGGPGAAALGAWPGPDARARLARAELALRAGDLAEAKRDAAWVATNASHWWEARWVLGWIAHHDNELDHAITLYDRVIADRPDFAAARTNRAGARLFRLFDSEASAGYSIARQARELGLVLEDVGAARELDVRDPVLDVYEGAAYTLSDRPEEARIALRRARERLDDAERIGAGAEQTRSATRALLLAEEAVVAARLRDPGRALEQARLYLDGQTEPAGRRLLLTRLVEAFRRSIEARQWREPRPPWTPEDDAVIAAFEPLAQWSRSDPAMAAFIASEGARVARIANAARILASRPEERSPGQWANLAVEEHDRGRPALGVDLLDRGLQLLRTAVLPGVGGVTAAPLRDAGDPRRARTELALRQYQGQLLLEAGRIADAVEMLESLPVTRPRDRLHLARALAARRDPRALDVLEEAVTAEPGLAEEARGCRELGVFRDDPELGARLRGLLGG